MNLETLFRLRLVVARYGEMDNAGWWNSKGQLSRLGATACRRGFPRTHYFAQARAVFAIAAHRCAEVFDPPNSVTLWRLPERIEQEFDARWENWLDNAGDWASLFEQLAPPPGRDLASLLRSLNVVTTHALHTYEGLRRSGQGRAVALPGIFSGGDDAIALLALGFARGEFSALTVPYAKASE